MENIVINTRRLILKSITPQVITGLFSSKSREEIMAFFGTDEKGYNHYKVMYELGMETHRISLYFFLILAKENNLPIGECGFHTLNKTHRRAELFYSLRNENDKRKGYMTEALNEVLEFGFTALGLHRIEALVASQNMPSVKLLEKYGFTKEGTMREDYVVDGKNEDSDCYSLLRWEWARRPSS